MLKKIILYTFVGIIVVVLGLSIWIGTYPELGNQKTPSGMKRCQSQYLIMRDDVKIAVDLWVPEDYAGEEELPTLIMGSRYSRMSVAYSLNFVDKLRIRFGMIDTRQIEYVQLDIEAIWANQAGYAVVFVDARGSAASFGSRPIEWSPEEIGDYAEVISWIAEQEWSNGKVGAWGTSYPGNTAELMASTGAPALLAVAPRFSDFDPLIGVGKPGGLTADGFLEQWSELNANFDSVPQLSKPVQGSDGKKLLEAALESHQNPNIAQAIRAIEFRDDEYDQSGLIFDEVSPFGLKAEIEEYQVPQQVWVSWLDAATTDGALGRFLTFDIPQQVIIGAWSHGGGTNIDPYNYEVVEGENVEVRLRQNEAMEPQMAQVLEFFDCYLKDGECTPQQSQITYYTLNSAEWQTSNVWPPEGFENVKFYLAEGGELSKIAPEVSDVSDEYTVDFTTSTGLTNRWMAQMGYAIDYRADRAEEDQKLLTYTSAPMETDIEITGSPLINLYIASSVEDCAFHFYLEDVAQDGKVTYITEGVLRAIHHQVSENEPPFAQLGPFHSFESVDASLLQPGEVTLISQNLFATSILIEKGHSLRLAIAGADADTFTRFPQEETPVWDIHRSSEYASFIELPIKVK